MIVSTTWQHFQVRFSEWYSATVLFVWGIYLILHPAMFTDPNNGKVFDGMAGMMPQQTWGLLGVLIGFARLFALYINGHHTRTPAIRLAASFFSAFLWTQVFIGFWTNALNNPGVVLYTSLVCADIYSAFRASGDVTLVSRRVRRELSGAGDR